jgi:hypothetical protein
VKFGNNIIEINDPKKFSHLVALSLNEHVVDGKTLKLQGQADSISHGHRSIIYKEKLALSPNDIAGFSSRGVFNLRAHIERAPDFLVLFARIKRSYGMAWSSTCSYLTTG